MTFIGISNNIAKQAHDSLVLKERDIRVIPNSVMLNRFRPVNKPEARTTLGLPSNSLILSTGAISLNDPHKGSKTLQFLLDTYSKETHIHWLIFGHGLGQLIDPVPENCTAFGSVKDDTLLNKIYAAADIFLMPSLQESFGKVTIEAMASGTPVIAYDNTPAEDMIINGATGWLVPHGNSKAFLAAVEKAQIVGREKLANMGKHAREDVLNRFSLDMVVNKHIKLYQELLGYSKNS
jgi:glycosyltransferase involved in cell wall biosynthesis